MYTAEKALKDNDAKIPQELKDEVNAKITALRGLKDSTDAEAIKKATEELSNEMSKIGEAVQKAGGTEGAPAEGQTVEEQPTEVNDSEHTEHKEGEEPKA